MTSGADNRRGTGRTATPLARLAAFALLLAVLAGVAVLAGRASGLEVEAPAGHNGSGDAAHGGESPAGAGGNGLSDTANGLRLQLGRVALEPGISSRLILAIVDSAGEPIAPLHAEHGEPPLHLILVRRDLAGYLHLHPKRSGERYAVDVALPLAGVWRAYADFEVDGEKTVLGHDLFVGGEFKPRPLAPVTDSARTGGYDVEYGREQLRAGAEATMRFRIARAGDPVTAFEPYLGAAGHLVAIRERDLAYLHVHPLGSPTPGRIDFAADFAEPGRYALFLQFKHEGRVRTARFTIEVAR